MKIEICTNSVSSAINAQLGGADRVELCENIREGGTSPASGSILLARKNLNISLFVMIRPRGSDFLYSDLEFDIMKEDVLTAKKLGADGIVSGILNADGTIDKVRMRELADLARPMSVTFHRAFDLANDPFLALEELIDSGVDRILTSGQQRTALKGAALIGELIVKAKERITIMPGGGIREENLEELIRVTGASEFHLNLTKKIPSMMRFIRQDIVLGSPDVPEYEMLITDAEKVRRIKEIINRNS